jgi:ABC-type Zn uptake system ZnuABC Zn-binding protein ZnuA
MIPKIILFSAIFLTLFSGCQAGNISTHNSGQLKGVATESFLADIARNITGDRVVFSSLIPAGMDPHAFEPIPADIVQVSQSDVLVQNGAGLEDWLGPVVENARGQRQIITASNGLKSRTPSVGETGLETIGNGVDPHFWLDPILVITYVENIRDGLIALDPAGREEYIARAGDYIRQLKDLDLWIQSRVAEIPPEKRLLVTNHETLGYFADRYGFRIVGSIIPGTSSGIAPGARDIASLVDRIRATGTRAVFLEKGSNTDLANQIASDTGIQVVTDLYTHSLSNSKGPAPTYIEMMKYDVNQIVDALKGP